MDGVRGFGGTLRQVRRALGLSQLALAGELGSTQRYVSFLETGRAQPSRDFVGRLCTDLSLSPGQRCALFEASGFASPMGHRRLDDAEVQEALDLLDRQILATWPYPAMVLDPCWRFLRLNAPAKKLLAALEVPLAPTPGLMEIFLSPRFREGVRNWEQVAPMFYFRLVSSAAVVPEMADMLARLKAEGVFGDLRQMVLDQPPGRLLQPIEMVLPGGAEVRLTSMFGHVAACQHEVLEGIEVELIVPADAASEEVFRAVFSA